MKKIFSLFVAALTTVTMFAAADVVLTSTEFEGLGTSGTGSEVKVEKGGITFICDKGFGDQYGVRCYKTSNVTITSSDKQIGKIYFEFATVSGKKYDGGYRRCYGVESNYGRAGSYEQDLYLFRQFV